ncbi:MAG: ribosomal protein methyltransferase [Gammaproteobacteria bacterium]|nr:ribosomal protein methyltransferase [Gammaproteobacteria bacterium]
MTWQQLTLYSPASHVDEISDLLTNAGAIAVTLESGGQEALFEPPPGATPLWQHTKIAALFEEGANLGRVISFLKMAVPPHIPLVPKISTIEERDWQQVCEAQFKPICFRDKLWICPSWHDVPDKKIPYVILDPGLAFGTGSHPTTALCLEWLVDHVKPGDTVIDYGCGSGILGISAIKLGATKVWAIDNDPQALQATQENALRNNINRDTLTAALPNALPNIQCDLLVANILANPLVELAPHFATLIKSGGGIALSGILHSQIDAIENAYAPWFQLKVPILNEEWVRISGRKHHE